MGRKGIVLGRRLTKRKASLSVQSSKISMENTLGNILEEVTRYYKGNLSYAYLAESLKGLPALTLNTDYTSLAIYRALSSIKYKTEESAEIPEQLLSEAISFRDLSDSKAYISHLELSYRKQVNEISANSLLSLRNLQLSDRQLELINVMMDLINCIESSEHRDSWDSFQDYLNRPGLFINLLRKLPFYIQTKQVYTDTQQFNLENPGEVSGLLKLLEIALKLIDCYKNTPKKSQHSIPITARINKLPDKTVPSYALGISLFNISKGYITISEPGETISNRKNSKFHSSLDFSSGKNTNTSLRPY